MEENFDNISSRKSNFTLDVLRLVSGTTFAQTLSVVTAPLITRLYSPGDMGLAALFVSITGILTVISSLRYEMSIMLPESDEDASNLLALSVVLTIIFSAITTLVIIILKQSLLYRHYAAEFMTYAWMIPIVLLFDGVFLAFNYWNSRVKRFKQISIANVTNTTTRTGTQLLLGFSGNATGGSLIIGRVFGSIIASLTMTLQTWRKFDLLFSSNIQWKCMINAFKRYRKFPLYDALAVLLNNISWQLPIFMFTYFFSANEAGYYALGNRVLVLPMMLIGVAIGQVFFQRAADANVKGTLETIVEDVFQRLVKLGLFPFLSLTIIAPELFIVVFGHAWIEAGVYVQILSVWAFVWFISSPMSTLFRVLEKQEFSLYINVLIFTTRIISLGIGGVLQNARLSLLLFATSGVFLYSYLDLAIITEAGVAKSRIVKILLMSFVEFIPAGLVLLLLKFYKPNPIIIVSCSIVMIGLYFVYVIKKEPSYFSRDYC